MLPNDLNAPVTVDACPDYDVAKIKSIISARLAEIGVTAETLAGKKVVVKPNLVMKKAPEFAATTHPAVLEGLLTVLTEMHVTPVIAESPGGIYSAQRLMSIYKTCGIEEVAARCGAVLNTDVSSKQMRFDDGKVTKLFNIITPIAEADVIFDLCKIKSHSLTTMSGAVKNLFGTVPGIEKFEFHAANPDYNDFSNMICDLCEMHCTQKQVIAVADAIIGMEGNGPTGGTPAKIGCILISKSPFNLDKVAAEIIGFDKVLILQKAEERMLIGKFEYSIPGGLLPDGFCGPDTDSGGILRFITEFCDGKFAGYFEPHPQINIKKCRGCGECAAACPQHTIEIKNGKAHIIRSKCIRCYCCQELCPFIAIKIKRNVFVNILDKIK